MTQPTAYEQFMLELINAERAKVGVQPLAFDGDLNEAADGHSQWMIDADAFSHTGSGGSSAGQRMTAAGYAFTGSWSWGENIAWATTRTPTGFQDEVQLLHTNLMNSTGHRANILNDGFREIGIGFEVGQYGTREGAFVTQDFARTGTSPFLTGVAFDDKDGDRFYDPGEGLGGITITATNTSTHQVYTTTTTSAGGYDMALAAGTYSVSFSGPGIATSSSQPVTIGTKNVKVDLVDPALSGGEQPAPPSPPPQPAAIVGTASGNTLSGTSGADTIQGLGGNDSLYGKAGDDRLEGGTGGDRLFGELGADVLSGGSGSDTFVFNTALNPATNVDRITDFSVPADTIQLENAVFAALTSTGTLASSAFYSGSAAHDATDRIIYNPSTGALTYDPDGNGAAAAQKFAQLSAGLALTNADFAVI